MLSVKLSSLIALLYLEGNPFVSGRQARVLSLSRVAVLKLRLPERPHVNEEFSLVLRLNLHN